MKSSRSGTFDGYRVNGKQFEMESGELAWEIHVGIAAPSYYMVSQGKFHSIRVHMFENGKDIRRIEDLGECEDVPSKEKAAALKAIAEWESEQA